MWWAPNRGIASVPPHYVCRRGTSGSGRNFPDTCTEEQRASSSPPCPHPSRRSLVAAMAARAAKATLVGVVRFGKSAGLQTV
jgi:hypothetical protein